MLAFGSQVLFARWMGTFQFGIYVYVWTWVLLLGQGMDLGSEPRPSVSSRNTATAAGSRSCAASCPSAPHHWNIERFREIADRYHGPTHVWEPVGASPVRYFGWGVVR